jgi:hypothetical protein
MQENEIKGVEIAEGEVKLSLFTHYMILYLKYSKNSTKILLDSINTFSNEAGSKINIQK